MGEAEESSLEQREEERQEELRRYVLQEAWDWTHLSNCLDKRLGGITVKDGRIIGRGSNLCAPPPYGYGDVLPSCPRRNSVRGTNRKKCRGFHAEIFACLSVRRDKHGMSIPVTPADYARFAWHQFDGEKKGARTRRVLQGRFTEEDRERLHGAELYLVGVAYVCDVCQWLLDWLGVTIHENNIIPPVLSIVERKQT